MLSLKTRSNPVAKKGLMAGMTEPTMGVGEAIGAEEASRRATSSSIAMAARRRIAGAEADISDY